MRALRAGSDQGVPFTGRGPVSSWHGLGCLRMIRDLDTVSFIRLNFRRMSQNRRQYLSRGTFAPTMKETPLNCRHERRC